MEREVGVGIKHAISRGGGGWLGLRCGCAGDECRGVAVASLQVVVEAVVYKGVIAFDA